MSCENFIENYGSRWENKKQNKLEKYIAELLIDLSDQVNKVSKTIPELQIKFVIFSNSDPRCFVYKCSSSNHQYLVGIHIGTFFLTDDWLSEELFRSTMDKCYLTSSLGLTTPKIKSIAFDLTIRSMLYHELSHIIRGHIGYIQSATNETEKLERIRFCEIDADKHSSYVLVADLIRHIKTIINNYPHSDQRQVSLNIIELVSIALYRCYSFYNQTIISVSSNYPAPLTRSTRITIGALDNLFEETSPIVFELLDISMKGMEKAESYTQSSSHQRDWDLSGLLELANTEKLLVQKMYKDLHKYSPQK